ncbi:hypothetical protein BYT27DRAFT_7179180 [Phlegmacium glaucopus]|nr:hypothetical protein BYT27DRAFT_7179180 [Phlegmacium glaucopus]
MTRSKGIPLRTAFNKHVRQKAHQEGTLFHRAFAETPGNESFYTYKGEHRSRSRLEGMQWNSKSFLSGTEVDDGELFIREEDVYNFKIDFIDTSNTRRHHTDMTISLLDIARPAKRKGVAKDFEVVQKVRNVIALEDDDEGLEYQWEDDEWEQIPEEQHTEPRSYASVLKGNET